MQLAKLKREGNLDTTGAHVAKAYELIAALAGELALLQADAGSHGYASPPAGTQTIVFDDDGPPSISSGAPGVIEYPASWLNILQASKR
ncbi:MAG TPA: hypothetical protein VEK14_03875 [Rhodomicrobium sp.]|nr:hypothetical protein [Rhodomicrobium sp.]